MVLRRSFLVVFVVVLAAAKSVLYIGLGCAEMHIITVRASTELPGGASLDPLLSLLNKHPPRQVSWSWASYQALLFPYASSYADDTEQLKEDLIHQVTKCPNQKIVFSEYNQDTHVIGDVLAGGGGLIVGLGVRIPPIDTAIGSMMSDPRHIFGESFNVGSLRKKGLFPRGSDQRFTRYASKIQAYCDSGDTFCDSGLDTAVHLAYTQKYNNAALAFVLNKIGG
ncbi:cutinase [Kalaharituber pfeilii]|nr:cutinase [Kalaharituber pfeilii]